MPSDRKHLPLALLAIVAGFTAVGATIQNSGKLAQADPTAMAQTVADYLRGSAALDAGAPSADVKTQAQSGAEALAQVLKSNLPAAVAKTATEDPNRIQLAAQAVATQLSGPPPAVAPVPVAIASPPAMTVAAASLAQWLSGTKTIPEAPAIKTPEAVGVSPAQPEAPAAAPSAMQTAQALQDQAGAMADAVNKEFGAILKKLPPDDADQTANADVAAAVAFSSLRYDANGTDSGLVTMSGRAKPGSKVAVYLDGQKLATAPTANNGRWLIATPQKLPIGQHVARVDMFDSAGKTAASAAYPFAREAAVAAGQESIIVPLTVASLKVEAPATAVAEHDPVVIIPPTGSVAQVAESPAAQTATAQTPVAKVPDQAAPVAVAEVPAKAPDPVAPALPSAAALAQPAAVAVAPAKPALKIASAVPVKRHLREATLTRLTNRRPRPVQLAAKPRRAVSVAALPAQLLRKQATRKLAALAKPTRPQIASVRLSPSRKLAQVTTSDQLVVVRVFHGKHAVTVKVPQGIMRSYAAAPQPLLRPVRKRRLRRRCAR